MSTAPPARRTARTPPPRLLPLLTPLLTAPLLLLPPSPGVRHRLRGAAAHHHRRLLLARVREVGRGGLVPRLHGEGRGSNPGPTCTSSTTTHPPPLTRHPPPTGEGGGPDQAGAGARRPLPPLEHRGEAPPRVRPAAARGARGRAAREGEQRLRGAPPRQQDRRPLADVPPLRADRHRCDGSRCHGEPYLPGDLPGTQRTASLLTPRLPRSVLQASRRSATSCANTSRTSASRSSRGRRRSPTTRRPT